MNTTYYFPHDYNTRNDKKIKRLIRKYGMQGYGIFWCLIEDLYNNNNELDIDYEGFASDLRCTPEIIQSVINDFGIFTVNDDTFSSKSVERRINERIERSVKARESAFKRYNKEGTIEV
jgi:hypothetical protein